MLNNLFIKFENNFLRKSSIKAKYKVYKQNPEYIKSIIKFRLRKYINRVFLFPLLVVFIPVVLVLRIIKPIITIRLGNLESDGIGHFSINVAIYLAEIECGIHKNDNVLDIWYLHKKVCNMALKEKWDEHLTILPRLIIMPIHLLNNIIPGGQENEIPYRRIEVNDDYKNPWQSVDIHNVLSKVKPKIKFSEEEKLQCIKILNGKGFDPTKKYVCLNVRDSAFHGECGDDHRNHSVNEFFDAITYLNELGYQVVRLGANVQENLKLTGPFIFDYATSGIRSELLDLYLISECEFLVSTGSGIDNVGNLFGKRIAYFNVSQIGTLPDFSYNSIIIFKRMKIRDEILSISSIFRNSFEKITLNYKFEQAGISLINNSKEEIRSVILETHERLNGIWRNEVSDKDSQDLFRSFFTKHSNKTIMTASIGKEFLSSIKI
jgi:putative glycosyltransferase (TIGR04372 family)